jgi:hypothetical protein
LTLDSGARRSYDPAMPLWRCPHCATPQPEAAHCWLCGKSTTSCAACRHYRRGVAGGLGLCGRDPRHLALRGTEVRPCWEAVPLDAAPSPRDATAPVRGRGASDASRPARTFVPVDELRAAAPGPEIVARDAEAGQAREPATTRGWSLWGDPEA